MVHTRIVGAGVVIIAIVRVTIGETRSAGAKSFVGAISVALTTIAGDAAAAEAFFARIAIKICNAPARIADADPSGGSAVGVAFACDAAALPVDASLAAEAILPAVARGERFAYATVALFVAVAIGVAPAFPGITTVREDRRSAAQEDTNPK